MNSYSLEKGPINPKLLSLVLAVGCLASVPGHATVRTWGGTLHRATISTAPSTSRVLATTCTLGADFSTVCIPSSPESFTYTTYGRINTPVGTANDREFLQETSTTAYYRNFIGLETVPEPRSARYNITFPVDVPVGYQIRLHGGTFEFESEEASSWNREFRLGVTLGVRSNGMNNETTYAADILNFGQSASMLRLVFADGQVRSYLNQRDQTALTVRSAKSGDQLLSTHCGGRQEIYAQIDMTAVFGSFPTISFTRAIQSYYKTTNTEFSYDPRIDAFTANSAPVTFELVPCAPGTPSAPVAPGMMEAPAAAPGRDQLPKPRRPRIPPGVAINPVVPQMK